VEHAKLPHAVAYAAVMVFQVLVNYLMCKAFVFHVPGRRANLGEFRRFTTGILVFRLLDWGVYLLLVDGLGVYYLLAQVFNVAVFGLVKFLFTERVLTGSWGGLEAPEERPAK
jgi:putative flippase GtrA